MKTIIRETELEGLEALLGKIVCVWCLNYIYAGTLSGVNTTDIKLTEAKVVYETGELTASSFQDAQPLPGPWYVRTSAIESYGEFHA